MRTDPFDVTYPASMDELGRQGRRHSRTRTCRLATPSPTVRRSASSFPAAQGAGDGFLYAATTTQSAIFLLNGEDYPSS